jgi:hypothetical protein
MHGSTALPRAHAGHDKMFIRAALTKHSFYCEKSWENRRSKTHLQKPNFATIPFGFWRYGTHFQQMKKTSRML